MAIYDYLTRFNYIEPNNLKGLQAGLVVAQVPVASSTIEDEEVGIVVVGDKTFMENGTICQLTEDGIVSAENGVAATPLFICYNEPLNTIYNADCFYAVDLDQEYPRLVQLMPGDEWMATREINTAAYGGSIIEITATSEIGKSDDFFKCTTMADGTPGHHYMFLH